MYIYKVPVDIDRRESFRWRGGDREAVVRPGRRGAIQPLAAEHLFHPVKKINRSLTHTPAENNTPDTDTHAHDKSNTPNPKRTPPTNTEGSRNDGG